jgi:hypothetical protein
MLLLSILLMGCETNTDGLRAGADAGADTGKARQETPDLAPDLTPDIRVPVDTRPAALYPGVDAGGQLTCVPAGECIIQADANGMTSVSCYANGVKVATSYDLSTSPMQIVYTTYTAGPGYFCTARNNPQPGLQDCTPGECRL